LYRSALPFYFHRMEIRSLEGTSVETITAAFNSAFDNYYVPLQLTDASMCTKIKSERISLSHSVGAFDDNVLTGFILHGIDTVDRNATAYNGGTGVIPTHRGNRLTEAMYRYAIEELSKQNIHHHVLEVIDANKYAKRVYEKIGFTTTRELGCYQGMVKEFDADGVTFCNGTLNDILPLTSSFAFAPTWQQTVASLVPVIVQHEIIVAKRENNAVAYAIYLPATARIKQFAVERSHQQKGIGKALFSYLSTSSATKKLMITNVDESHSTVGDFIMQIGLQRFLGMYEMTCSFTY
jgi:ribosomal protein S18 acetylase RimI-like enzyme